MNRIYALTFLMVVCCLPAFSQDTVFLKRRDSHAITVTDRPPQAFYAELGGKALIFSVNYDRRFSKRTDGLGFSVGGGYLRIDNVSLYSVPVGLNYLLGKNGKYLELGAGATYLSASITDFNNASDNGHTVVGTMTIGYRSQPVRGGFMFRAGINPIFFKDNFIPYDFYIGLGYNF